MLLTQPNYLILGKRNWHTKDVSMLKICLTILPSSPSPSPYGAAHQQWLLFRHISSGWKLLNYACLGQGVDGRMVK